VLLALVITGTLSALASKVRVRPVLLRVLIGGAIAMIVTYGIGRLFNISGV
jgi:VIT1/CCC1 family predicted Fe2+/Mn2+ transporter